jgi:trans-aconitate methyltransferase
MPYELHQIGTRDQLRVTFDEVAQLYDQMRPSYPDAVFDDVIALSGVDPSMNSPARVLEIGCGTGHATRAMAARGLSIDCVELGEKMAAVARQRLAQFPGVSIEVADFDHWTRDIRYDLIYLATAYHWLNPATRERRIAALLKSRGLLATWRNRHIRNGSSDDYVDEAQIIYMEEAPELTKDRAQLPGPDDVVEAEREVLSPELFDEPIYRVYYWSRAYTAVEFVQELDTHSDLRLLPADRRARLFERLAHLIESRFGGSVVKDYATVLQLFRRKH